MPEKDSKQKITFDLKFFSTPFGLVVLGLAFVVGAVVIDRVRGGTDRGNVNVTSEVVVKKGESQIKAGSDFIGDKGVSVTSTNDQILIDESQVSDGNMHAFNYYSQESKKNIYFFVVKASDNTYRVAANACEVCYGSKKGFTQVGDKIRCENCQTIYTKDQIAKQKGGCNPRPIDDNAKIEGGKLVISLKDLESAADLF